MRLGAVLRRTAIPWSGTDEPLLAPKTVDSLDTLLGNSSAYDALPEGIKAHVTLKEFRWMGQHNRDRLHQDFTEPDYYED